MDRAEAYNVSVLGAFKECGALLEGHFLLTSGRHSSMFLLAAQVTQYPEIIRGLAGVLSNYFRDDDIDTVIGPAIGGIILAHEVASALGARSIFTEKGTRKMELRRGFQIEKGERILAVEDAITTGGSLRKTLDAVEGRGGNVIAVGALLDRSGGAVEFGVPLVALAQLNIESYLPEDCPLCKEGISLTQPKAA